ncbi:MAG: leucyl aminopeptidase [Candidatus Marinimicrobia bacterium]|nr:leucyl aminopeptidase [Candidatus Neomarinimicrobiota bacterium]|tara:strand:+ start:2730 stop:4193 length:1464 start_codon:yes stop_codon:yes gene_type:complete
MVILKNIKVDNNSLSSDILVLGRFKDSNVEKSISFLGKQDQKNILDSLSIDLSDGDSGDYIILPGSSNFKRIMLFNLGDKKKLTNDKMRAFGSKLYSLVNSKKITKMVLDTKSFSMSSNDKSQSMIEGMVLGSYKFEDYKSNKNKKNYLTDISLMGSIDKTIVKKAQIIGESVCFARDLGNHPANILTPTYLANESKRISKAKNMNCTVIDVSKFEKMGLGSFYGVARGAKEPAKMIIVEYNGASKSQKPIALVGKGLTFDTGGISLKPGARMDEMKFDMCGSATVMGVMNAVSVLQPKINIIFAIGSTENMPGSDAQRPGDIVTAYNGKTIEVLNTDAEGRLVLADVLSYVDKNYKPECMIDFATLTGAVLVALGHRASGLMGNDDKLINKIKKSSIATDEKVWELPLWDEYSKDIQGKYADIQNLGKAGAGTITAGAFLKEFVGDTPWCHLDIAGTAWGPKEPEYQPKVGATGVAVRLIYHLLEN